MSVKDPLKLHWSHGRAAFRRPDVPHIDRNLLLAAYLETDEQRTAARSILRSIVERKRKGKKGEVR